MSKTKKILCFIVNSTMLELLNSISIVSYQLQRNLINTVSNKTIHDLFRKLKNNNKSAEAYVFRRISPTKFLPRGDTDSSRRNYIIERSAGVKEEKEEERKRQPEDRERK